MMDNMNEIQTLFLSLFNKKNNMSSRSKEYDLFSCICIKFLTLSFRFKTMILFWLSLQCLFGIYVRADWPSSDSYKLQLLGLFPDLLNISEPSIPSFHFRAMFISALILSHRYNITVGGEFIGWQSVETGGDVIGAFRSSCLAISTSNIVGIVGPGYSRESEMIAPFAKTIGIPVISYSSTDSELSDRDIYPAFYRTVPSDNSAALALVQLFHQYNWTSCIIIYQNDVFGSGGADVITDAFNQNNLIVTDTIVFDITTLRIRGDLRTILTSNSIRIVILWAGSEYISIILQDALDNDVIGPQFTWILSEDLQLNDFNQKSSDKLNGILTVQPVVGSIVNAPINKTLLNAAYDIWQEYEPETFPGPDNVNYYALFAFDATWALIQSLQKFCHQNFSSCISFVNTSFCFDRQLQNSDLFYNIIDHNQFLGVSGWIEFSVNVTDRISETYYIAKNIQQSSNGLINVPVLAWSNSNGWTSNISTNVIVWPGQSLIPPSGYASVSGIILQIAVTETAPFTIVTQIVDQFGRTQIKLTGYVPDLIEALREKMGFIPNITLISNETFDDIVDIVANNTYDMFVAQTTITSARREIVGFSDSIFDNSLRIIIRRDSTTNIDFLSYLRSFSFQLWLILLIASIYAGFLICLLESQVNEALKGRSIISLISMGMWYSVGTLVGYGVDFHVTTGAGRLLTLGLYILSLILVAAYTANLASDLTISRSDIISGIDDIKNGKIAFSRIGILVGSSLEDYYLQEISGGNRNFYPVQTKQEIYDDLLNYRIDASIMDAAVVEYITNNVYCNLTLVGDDFGASAFGIAFPKNWLYQQELDINILSLREAGILDNLRSKWFDGNICGQSSDSTSTAMTIESLAGLFLTFGIISILAVLLYVWQKRVVMKKSLLKFVRQKKLLMRKNVSVFDSPSEISSISKSVSYPTIYL
jgi:ABC-type amino acid transport substrate-binding protein/ABC-type branched-subunit amino acid transport system substrate-binding protein